MLVVLSITPQCPVIEQRLATRWMIGPQASFWMKSGTLIIKKNRFGTIWSWRHCSANFLLETIWNPSLCKHILYIAFKYIFIIFNLQDTSTLKGMLMNRNALGWDQLGMVFLSGWLTNGILPYALRNGCIQPSRLIWHVATRLPGFCLRVGTSWNYRNHGISMNILHRHSKTMKTHQIDLYKICVLLDKAESFNAKMCISRQLSTRVWFGGFTCVETR